MYELGNPGPKFRRHIFSRPGSKISFCEIFFRAVETDWSWFVFIFYCPNIFGLLLHLNSKISLLALTFLGQTLCCLLHLGVSVAK